LGITPNFTLDIDPDPNEMAKISQAKKKKRRKKRNSLAETASKDSSWRRPYCLIQTLGFLL
jgi:hypothetical protein